METQILPVGDVGAVERAVELLTRGEPVVFPTDTVYGVGAHALLPEAVARLFEVKQRPSALAIPLLLPDADSIKAMCVDVPDTAWVLARRFWPGALSLVLRRAPIVPDAVTAGGPSVAVRVPGHSLARDLCRRLGAPLAVTSANLHSRPDPVTADEAFAYLKGRLPLILDGGASPGGMPSTLLDLTRVPPVIVRAGPITREEIAQVLGEAVF